MVYKRIYLVKRNHSVICSSLTVSAILAAAISKAVVGEAKEFPSYETIARRLRTKTEISFRTSFQNYYEFIEMQNSRYKRTKR
jgi:hypothetical protein